MNGEDSEVKVGMTEDLRNTGLLKDGALSPHTVSMIGLNTKVTGDCGAIPVPQTNMVLNMDLNMDLNMVLNKALNMDPNMVALNSLVPNPTFMVLTTTVLTTTVPTTSATLLKEKSK